MLDLKFIRENMDSAKEAVANRQVILFPQLKEKE